MKFRSNANLIFRYILCIISPKLAVKFLFFYYHRRFLNLKTPKTLDEKIQWMKIYYYKNNELVRRCANKLTARDYVKECGLERILIPLIAKFSTASEIKWSDMPDKFVLKWNFGNGGNVVCQDKDKLNIIQTIKDLNRFQKLKFHLIAAEPQYNVEKVILCEKFIEGENGGSPTDYKVYCFNGIAKYVLCCYGRGIQEHPSFYIMNRDWKLERLNKQGLEAPKDFTIPKPDGIDKIFEYAEILSKPFPFVRVDFYLQNGNVYFGELTFTPAGGFDVGRLPSSDLLYGNLVELPLING